MPSTNLAAARSAIVALVHAYPRLQDTADFEGIGKLFAKGRFSSTMGRSLGGAELAADRARGIRLHEDGTPRTSILTTNLLIDIDDAAGAARARSYYAMLKQPPGEPLRVVGAGRYYDDFVREDGDWRFEERVSLFDLSGDVGGFLRAAPRRQPSLALRGPSAHELQPLPPPPGAADAIEALIYTYAERIDLAGVPVTLVDTAGVRNVTDEVEREGVQRSLDAIEIADVILLVLDLSQPLTVDDAAMIESTQARARVVVANKMDLPSAWDPASVEAKPRLVARVSATGGGGLADVRDAMLIALGAHGVEADGVAVTNLRHVRLLEEVEQALERALVGARARRSEEFLLADLLAARVGFESITGKRTPEDLLEHIFSSFCIGK